MDVLDASRLAPVNVPRLQNTVDEFAKARSVRARMAGVSTGGRPTSQEFGEYGQKPLYGRDALFMGERLRQDYWKRHKDQTELLLYKEKRAQGQRRAEYTSEVRRIDGHLQKNLTQQFRTDFLAPRKKDFMMKLGLSGVEDLPPQTVGAG